MRFIFVDEAGTGNPNYEPYVVVAAIVVHADYQLLKLEQYLAAMAHEFVPPDKRAIFKGFHAVELYAGGAIFERDKEQIDRWWHILDELASIPQKFDMPICWGWVTRSEFLAGGKYHDGAMGAKVHPVVAAQMAAFAQVSVSVDHWFNSRADTGEIGQFVLENNPHSNQLIRETHRVLGDPRTRKIVLPDPVADLRNVHRVRWPIYFEEKGESNATQVADFCAWALARRLRGAKDSARFCNPILPYLVNQVRESIDGVLLPRG